MRLDDTSVHTQLQEHQRSIASQHMRDWFASDPQRAQRFSLQAPYLTLDYSKNRITDQTCELLLSLAREANMTAHIDALFSGQNVNNTEHRPALHTALRASPDTPVYVNGENILTEIQATRARMHDWVRRVHQGEVLGYSGKPIDTLVSIGIGGSFLGPKMVVEALQPFARKGLSCHFIANIDGADLYQTLDGLNVETTAFLVQSKSFSTLETLENARAVQNWQRQQGLPDEALDQHWLAVSANVPRAEAFGVSRDNIFPMWDWVGGRYSLWSAIGLPIAFVLGNQHFDALLEGAQCMDTHFRTAPLAENMPVILALLGIWYGNYFGAQSHAILAYDEHLYHFPEHLQQLDMESSGKCVDRDGQPLTYPSGQIIWGGVGSNGQHAFHQLLHQGTQLIPADFIIALQPHHPFTSHHEYLFTNCLSQSQALMRGKSYEEALRELQNNGVSDNEAARLAPHKMIAGNKPSNTLLMEQLTPHSLGALTALYEHKVFAQGVLWHINSFDQWGVELGKALSASLFEALHGKRDHSELDSSTLQLLLRFKHQG